MVGEIVVHRRFGRGEITEFAAPHITVRFEESATEKRFAYPQAFEAFLSFESDAMQAQICEDLKAAHETERLKKEALAEAAKQREAELIELRKAEIKAKRTAAARKASETRNARKSTVKA